ncbi:hypothetical protein HFN97_26145 [Rhizobium laguerreae]|uniref:hypothetical protein n=1 Tax=Rhizobium laguerreae TaxID=1076926 RepID=UPI001C9083B3|nr:hypothetical protein [Rhizobium laguerreae]MBY3361257.1 hypothetical protein [Rhizobium laguerreae]
MSIFKPGHRATVTGQSQQIPTSPSEGAVVLDWREHYARRVMNSLTRSGALVLNAQSSVEGRVVDLSSVRRNGGQLDK